MVAIRAAIYTRKSTDEGLNREFTTLDNRRERGAAYATSQGWMVVDAPYDDGGCDFVNLHRLLEEHGVEIVSVTEPIDTRVVRDIFALYLERLSLLAVVQELSRRGWRRKSWTTRDGRVRHGREWNAVDLHRFLTNPLYAGLQKIGDETFCQVQAQAAAKRRQREMADRLTPLRRPGGRPRGGTTGAGPVHRDLGRAANARTQEGRPPADRSRRLRRGEAPCCGQFISRVVIVTTRTATVTVACPWSGHARK